MLAEGGVCEVVEVRFTAFGPVLLGVFARHPPLDNLLTPAVDTRQRLAKPGKTESSTGTARCDRLHRQARRSCPNNCH